MLPYFQKILSGGLLLWLVMVIVLPLGANLRAAEVYPTVDRILVDKSDHRLHLVAVGRVFRSYRISLGSHPIGDKVQKGDKKTPEGHYVIDWRNPDSLYYRAFHISYPNAADRAEARRLGVAPGGMIMIHGLPDSAAGNGEGYVGMDWTDGCIALTNAEIDQLWDAVKDGTPVEIVP